MKFLVLPPSRRRRKGNRHGRVFLEDGTEIPNLRWVSVQADPTSIELPAAGQLPKATYGSPVLTFSFESTDFVILKKEPKKKAFAMSRVSSALVLCTRKVEL